MICFQLLIVKSTKVDISQNKKINLPNFIPKAKIKCNNNNLCLSSKCSKMLKKPRNKNLKSNSNSRRKLKMTKKKLRRRRKKRKQLNLSHLELIKPFSNNLKMCQIQMSNKMTHQLFLQSKPLTNTETSSHRLKTQRHFQWCKCKTNKLKWHWLKNFRQKLKWNITTDIWNSNISHNNNNQLTQIWFRPLNLNQTKLLLLLQ